jgi:hypothetical protein
MLGIPYHKRGLLLSKEYYLSIEDKLLDNIPSRLYKNICIGLFGLGSECYKLDDIISEDHDFEPNIIILVDDDIIVATVDGSDGNKINFSHSKTNPGDVKDGENKSLTAGNSFTAITEVNVNEYGHVIDRK